MMREGIDVVSANLITSLKASDSNPQRANVIVAAMTAIELARQQRFRDALKELNKEIQRSDADVDIQRSSLSILQKLLTHHPYFRAKNLFDFYNFLSPQFPIKLAKLSSGAAKVFYENNSYEKVALSINTNEETSIHRTIHKAKGAEFDNVLLILGQADDFDEASELGFILSPDLTNNEEHRVNYVAVSRARDKLFVNVPFLSVLGIRELENKGFVVVVEGSPKEAI